ncbi:MAG: class I SAM-dependent methyltransferase [Salibacteraceae bacterium]
MLDFSEKPQRELTVNKTGVINSFVSSNDQNFDSKTVDSFGEEWLKFKSFSEEEIETAGSQYFDIVSDNLLKDAIVLDMGCGSGRWTKYIAPKVKFVEAIDPSEAVYSAHHLTKENKNVRITQAGVDCIPFKDESFDLAICLGVLHHIPDTQKALIDMVKKVKIGGSILLYLYYKLDNRGFLYRLIFKLAHVLRLVISSLPKSIKKLTCDLISVIVYMPLVLLIRALYGMFGKRKWIAKIPLSYYSDKSFNIIRNDALDRFGTPLEQRFTQNEIEKMMHKAGLKNVVFSKGEPYWHMTGEREQ